MAYGCGYDDTLNKQGPSPLKLKEKPSGGEKRMRKDKMKKIKRGIIKDPVTNDPAYLKAKKKYDQLKAVQDPTAERFRNQMNSNNKMYIEK
jgi:hypothetical protein